MDLRRFSLTEDQISIAKKILGYQPFIISDNVQTGIAYAFLYGEGSPMVMEKDNVSEIEWKKFVDANARMRKMYDDWISATCAIAGDLSRLSVIDTACNTGYFLYRFWGKGVRNCVGHDRGDCTAAIRFMNSITGYNIRFVHEPYNPLTHRIEGCPKHDIVVSSAIMCHLSDPLNYISFLASIAKKLLLIHTRVSEEDGYVISYGKPNKYYAEDPFPVCFDNDVTVSRRLLFESLRLAGFQDIQEIEYMNEWLPYDWYCSQKTLLAIRGADTANPTRAWNYSGRRAPRIRKIRSLLGEKLFGALAEFVKSRPRLKSFAKRLGL